MNILLIVLTIVALWGASFSFRGYPDYIGRAQTDSIKGIFAIIILYSHMKGYLSPPGRYDLIYYRFIDAIGQLMVVMFLLYSGYGVMESLKRNRMKYYNTFLTHRILKIWLMFAIAVLLFLILSFVLGHEYSSENYLWCWIGWESIGNSNWFVFDILVLYLFTYLSLFVANRLDYNLKVIVLSIFILTILFSLSLKLYGKGEWWYDTIVAYPVGMIYSLYKPNIEKATKGYRWIVCIMISTVLFLVFRHGLHFDQNSKIISVVNHLMLISSSSLFAISLTFATMKLKLDNKALRWLGQNAFAIYILQRLSMIICAHYRLNENSLVFSAIVIPSTLLIAAIFTAMTNRMNAILFKK